MAALQLALTGISQDFFNPVLVTTVAFQLEGMPLRERSKLIDTSIEEMPATYRDFLVGRQQKFHLDLIEIDDLLARAGDKVPQIDALLGGIKGIKFGSATAKAFERKKQALAALVGTIGEIIYGPVDWSIKAVDFRASLTDEDPEKPPASRRATKPKRRNSSDNDS